MPCGVHSFDMAGAKHWIQKGKRFMACGNEVTWLVDSGQKATAEIKEAIPR
jgi:2-keto-3-deoxy-L-rhamnonate aldolase RhmA